MSNAKKVDLRDSLHICPFCRDCVVQVPAFWEWPSEVEEMIRDHILECVNGIADVTFK